MSITLGPVTLPAGLLWSDEYQDQPIAQTIRRRLDGGLAVYAHANLAGRPITLTTGADQWLTRAQGDALAALAAVPGALYTLTFSNRTATTFTVAWRHQDAPALDLQPLIDYADPVTTDLLVGTIKLMTV